MSFPQKAGAGTHSHLVNEDCFSIKRRPRSPPFLSPPLCITAHWWRVGGWGAAGGGGAEAGSAREGLPSPSFPRAQSNPFVPSFPERGISPNAPSWGLTVPQTSHPLCNSSLCPLDAPDPPPGGAGCSHGLPGAEQRLHDQMGMDTLPGGPRPSALAAHVPRSSLRVFHGSLFPCSSPISPSSVRP